MDIRIIEITSKSEWTWALETVGGADVYYMPGYLIPLAQRGEGRPILVMARQGKRTALHVTFIRKLSSLAFLNGKHGDRVDLCSPYGFSGPVLSEPDPAFASAFWDAWCQRARDMGAVSEFIRFHPLMNNYLNFSEQVEAKLHGQTVYIDLTRERIASGFSKTCLRNIRTAYKKDVEFEILNPVEWISAFLDLYYETMDRRKAPKYYYFDEDYFMRLFDEMVDSLWLARAHYQGRTGAFGLFLRYENYLHYHLGCSDHDLRALCPTNLLLYETALWAKKRNKIAFHLGGAFQGNPGLYRFKKGFSDRIADFYVGQVIYDRDVYDDLVQTRIAASPRKLLPDFFPAYRSAL